MAHLAHQAHNIPWSALTSNLQWRLSNPCKTGATDFHLRCKVEQEKKLTYFSKAFVRNIHNHADTERKKYPDKYDPPGPDAIVISDDVTLRIAPTVRRWRKTVPAALRADENASPNVLCPHTDDAGSCRCIVQHCRRKSKAFFGKCRFSGCYRFFDVNKDSFFNSELVKTLLLYGEMDTILRVCENAEAGLKSWWKQQECQCMSYDLGWDQVAHLALDSYILLNVIFHYPHMWEVVQPGQKDYRRTRSYQSLVWRNTRFSKSDVVKYPHRQFFGIKDDQFRSHPSFRDSKRWSHLHKAHGKHVLPFGHLPYEEFLACQELVDYEPAPSDVSHVRWILCEQGLPVEISEKILNLASFSGQRRLPVPHHPFHPENREELGKYLTYCWQLVVRCEILGRALSMNINWEYEVSLALARLFNCGCSRAEGSKFFTTDYDDDV